MRAALCGPPSAGRPFDADYFFNQHFDVYAGAMYSGVHNGLANGYVYNTTNINPTIGLRYKFWRLRQPVQCANLVD